MSPRYENADIDMVRERADIVEVVSDHVRLRRAGRSYKGLCPFHQEKTPSFTVDRDKGMYYCHGCHEGGTVFTFVAKVENLAFTEAVEILARRFGVELRQAGGSAREASPRARLVEMHELAVEHYRKLLAAKDAAPVRAYLEERGIGQQTAERYRIGFGGWRRDSLVRSMVRAGYTTEELVSAGLASGDGRATRDTFHGRVLFPIFDVSDRPVGFGGRVLPEAYQASGSPAGPKYLNTRETPIFRKSKVLYGANWARGDVVRTKRLVVVEGYTDVIALHSGGVSEAVATCGTALTEQHMQEVSRRFGDVRVILCNDSDAAGQAAMARSRTEELAGAYSPGDTDSSGWLPVGRGWLPEVYVALLPQGEDPADFIRSRDAGAVSELLDEAIPLVEFLLRHALAGERTTSPEARTKAVRRGADILAQVGDALLRHEYALWLADRTGVDPYEVAKAVEQRVREAAQSRRGPAPAAPEQPAALSGHQRVEREALRALVSLPGLLDDQLVDESDFVLPLHRSVLRLLHTEWTQRGTIDVGGLTDRVQDAAMRRTITELAVGEVADEVVGREMLSRVRQFALARQIEECKRRLRELDPDREAEAYDALFEKLLHLENHRRSLVVADSGSS